MDYEKDFNKKVREFKLSLIQAGLPKCTQKQQDFFHKLYPNGPSEEQMPHAYDQIMRTLDKNAKEMK